MQLDRMESIFKDLYRPQELVMQTEESKPMEIIEKLLGNFVEHMVGVQPQDL